MNLTSWARRVALGIGIGLVVAACGDDDDGASSARNALINEICAGLDDCCKADGKANDVSSCVQFYSFGYSGKTYDEAKGQTCLASIKAKRQDGSFCGGAINVEEDSDDEACAGAFRTPASAGGTKQPGEACGKNSDCALVTGATDATCLISIKQDGSQEQYCEVDVVRAPGESCDDEKGYNISCNEKAGDRCDFSTKKCVAAKTEGEECGSGDCAPGLYCALGDTAFVCAKQLAAGEACDEQGACVSGTYCADDKTCTAKLANGAACTTSSACKGGNCADGKCANAGSITFCTNPN